MTRYAVAEPVAQWIDQQVASGRYRDAESYLAELVARDREDAESEAVLKAAIAEGLASGVSELTFEDIVAEARASLVNS